MQAFKAGWNLLRTVLLPLVLPLGERPVTGGFGRLIEEEEMPLNQPSRLGVLPGRSRSPRHGSGVARRWIPTIAATLLLGAVLSAQGARAGPIASYDILDTPASGAGGWSHAYDGTITLQGVNFINAGFGGSLADYSGGSGTLNDGVVGTTTDDTHLLVQGPATDGTPIDPVITLDLGGLYTITSISIRGGADPLFLIPGRIGELTVEIGGIQQVYSTTPFGEEMIWGGLQDDLITISGSHVGVATSTITLSGFGSGSEDSVGGSLYNGWFSITEIELTGQVFPAPVPALGPRGLGALLLLLAATGFLLLQRKQVRGAS